MHIVYTCININVYIYIHVYVYIYIKHTCIYIYIHIKHTYVYINILCIYIYIINHHLNVGKHWVFPYLKPAVKPSLWMAFMIQKRLQAASPLHRQALEDGQGINFSSFCG